MRGERRHGGLCVVAALAFAVGCGSSPPPMAPQPAEEPVVEEPESPPETVTTNVATPESQRPPSTLSYDEALATPEPLDPTDTRIHLTDVQLTNPMRQVMGKCRMGRNAKVTIKVAVQMGRAIGVTGLVTFEKPKGQVRRQSPQAAKMEAKAAAKIAACFDKQVRLLVWPPSPRRDSFTTAY